MEKMKQSPMGALESREGLLMGIEHSFWDDENALKLDSGDGCTIL